jgi:hypothetical protein
MDPDCFSHKRSGARQGARGSEEPWQMNDENSFLF